MLLIGLYFRKGKEYEEKSLLVIFCIIVLTILVGCNLITPSPDEKLELKFEDQSFVYDGNEHVIELEGEIPENYTVEYDNNAATGLGEFNAIARVYDEAKELVKEYYAKLSIEAEFDRVDYIADGNTFEHILDCEVEEGFELKYINNSASEQGIYYTTAQLLNSNTQEVVQEYYSVMIIDNEPNDEFELLMDEILLLLFEGDQMSLNFFFNDYTAYGFEHQEAVLSKYVKSENFEADQAEIQLVIDEVNEFQEAELSFEQRDTLEIVINYLEYIYSITESMNYMGNGYIGSYLGMQCNLPLELAEYKFREEQDIVDFISILESSYESFLSYYQYTVDQVEYGTATPNYVIDNVIAQCDEFVAMGEENFLIDIFNAKIDSISFQVSDHTVEEYKELAKNAIVGPLTNAYKYLSDNLPALKDKATIEGGLAQYGEEGLAYYLLKMKNVLGVKDFDGEKAIKYLENSLFRVESEIGKVVQEAQTQFKNDQNQYNKFVAAATGNGPNYSTASYEGLIEYFQYISTQLVPSINAMPEITINYVPESLQESFSPAAYFVSPIDETSKESIYLNPLYQDDYNYIFTTLAHEGYPGHLYQNVYSKNLDINDVRKVIRCSGYMEGWATYVENKAYYFAPVYTSQAYKLALEYNQLNNEWGLYLNALCDLAIHYTGMTLEKFAAYLTELIGTEYTAEDAAPIYYQLAEIPTNMSMYAISFSILDALHDCAEEKLGKIFNEVEFNKVILDSGAAPLYMVIENVYEYINEVVFCQTGEIVYPNL